MSAGVRIGQLARNAGVGIHAIRFYERRGLLRRPPRSEGGYRLFDPDDARDLKFIRKAQSLGFSLAEIRELLILERTSAPGCVHVRDLLRRKLSDVRSKIEELKALEAQLASGLRKCQRELNRSRGQPEKGCPVLKELADAKESEDSK